MKLKEVKIGQKFSLNSEYGYEYTKLASMNNVKLSWSGMSPNCAEECLKTGELIFFYLNPEIDHVIETYTHDI